MKKIFLIIALVLCSMGTAFADKYYKSESEFYTEFDASARKYKWCAVVDVFEDGFGGGYVGSFDDNCEVFYYDSNGNECVYIFFADDWQVIQAAINVEDFKSWSLHWFELPKNNYKVMTLTKALIEVCK